nr:HU family DNA-binding protein [Neolewinella xylanilytica]
MTDFKRNSSWHWAEPAEKADICTAFDNPGNGNKNYRMRKADLVANIADKTGIAKVDVLVSLESFFKEVKGSLAEGENVYIRGFGSFVVKKRAKKIGRHIQENRAIEIPEHFIPAFKPAKIFVEQVKDKVSDLPDDESDYD